jgi:hypothetical protein
VLAQKPLFCWTSADEACTEGRLTKSTKTDDTNRKAIRYLAAEDTFRAGRINLDEPPISPTASQHQSLPGSRLQDFSPGSGLSGDGERDGHHEGISGCNREGETTDDIKRT